MESGLVLLDSRSSRSNAVSTRVQLNEPNFEPSAQTCYLVPVLLAVVAPVVAAALVVVIVLMGWLRWYLGV